MEKLGTSAKKVLEYINEKTWVSNEELHKKFGADAHFATAALFDRKFVFMGSTSDDPYDWCISPMGKDHLESAEVEDVKERQLADHHLTVKHIDTTVVDLTNQVAILERGLEEERKRAEKAEEHNKWFSVIITIFGAALSVWISTWVN